MTSEEDADDFIKHVDSILSNYDNQGLAFVPEIAVPTKSWEIHGSLYDCDIYQYCLANNIPIVREVISLRSKAEETPWIVNIYACWLLTEKDYFELRLRGLTSEHQIRKVTVKHGGNNV